MTDENNITPSQVGKKRRKHPETYARNVRKKCRLEGKQYVNSKGKLVAAKERGPPCKCRRRCFDSFTELKRKAICNRFYELELKNIQDTFLQDLITVLPVNRRRRVKEIKTRGENVAHFQYHVRVESQVKPVCLKAFVAMYGITKKRVNRLRILSANGESPNDKRGKLPSNVLDAAITAKVKKHIESFPRYESHYSSVSYLSPQLNIDNMYSLFKLKYPAEKISYSSYRRIFNYDYKLSFGQPEVDICGQCEEWKTQLKNKMLSDSVKQSNVAEKMVHLRRSKKFHVAIKKDRMEKNVRILSICFDYMQNINVPRIPVQESFYKKQLTISVFCVHHIQTNKSRLYVYNETEGKKGPNEVWSFLSDFIFNELEKRPNQYQVLHLYSDNCGGQNKNHCVLRFMQALSDNNTFRECQFFFPLHGHNYNDCDRNFGLIKKQLKTYDRIYMVRQVIQIIAGSGINKFEVVRIRYTDILNFKTWWAQYYTRNATAEETKDYNRSEKVNFNIQSFYQFLTTNEIPGVMIARPHIDGLMQYTFVLRQKGTVFPVCLPKTAAYLEQLQLTKEKLGDVQDLIKYVPPKLQSIYKRLK